MKVLGLYNAYFYERLYSFMVENNYPECLDICDVAWTQTQVRDILVNQFGWELSA